MEKTIVIQLYQFIANYTAYRHLYGHLIFEEGLSASHNWIIAFHGNTLLAHIIFTGYLHVH